MVTRIASLKGFNNVLAGRDLNGVFKPGHVYEFYEIAGEIMCRDLGEGAPFSKSPEIKGYKISQIMLAGFYMLTKSEYEAQLKAEKMEYGE